MRLARAVLDDLRGRAEHCLASLAPTTAEAHELAAVALEVLSRVEPLAAAAHDGDAFAIDHPYRDHAFDPSETGAIPAIAQGETSRVTALERALEACQLRLYEARAEIARRGG